ncbi:TetR/AcrR family transcriptional regulator [Nocardia pseudobrasiliensis]|uniref:TetR family transcriptional regulator n=1 Tax=Nocardia pseudobrasiliensis TaxID=45979 RepID=A0A370I881_9NOCA|nr:TetR/AcrR family transcriptional regulator [Nocardia pseudobrasiliensis]RDI66331.1 TetR family transcriptional regulator [Nocardia pseudobrasiliensis]
MTSVAPERQHRRREPVQERSRERVERLLTAARELLDEQGPQAVTTRSIAERARLPVATLYQYFANREAVLGELALRLMDRLDEELPQRLAALPATTLPDMVHQLMELHREMYRSEYPDLVPIYYESRRSGATPDAIPHRRRFAHMVHESLITRGLLPADTDPLITELAVELGERAVELAYRHAPGGDPVVLSEGTLAVTLYLESHAGGGG